MRTLLLGLFAAAALQAQDGFEPLFNGKDLEEWIVDTPGLWRVENGVIIGVSKGLKYNDFLRTRRPYSNFVLQVSFRMIDPGGQGNSGIQFRSKAVEGSHEVAGYQADIGQKYWGGLYDESRRKRVLVEASPAALASVKKDGWNQYVIAARGNRITLDLNGVRSVTYIEDDPEVEPDGFIALQLHSGPPMEVQFKDLRIRDLR